MGMDVKRKTEKVKCYPGEKMSEVTESFYCRNCGKELSRSQVVSGILPDCESEDYNKKRTAGMDAENNKQPVTSNRQPVCGFCESGPVEKDGLCKVCYNVWAEHQHMIKNLLDMQKIVKNSRNRISEQPV